MHFIFGGRGMGMMEYAKGLFTNPVVCDLAHDGVETMRSADIISNIHFLVKHKVMKGEDALGFIRQIMPELHNKVVIGDEVGCGVVPVDPFEREWRDETGRVYQLLAANAKDVTRVWAGIPKALKRDGKSDA
jgi:adenosylcobinamide kinase / adenosylcobinamide-phosphate guanylyltransferase